MNQEFSNCVIIAMIRDIEKVVNGEVVMKAGKAFDTFHSAEFSLNPQSRSQKGVLLHSIDATLYIDKASPEMIRKYAISRSVIIQFMHGSDRLLAAGSLSYPAKVYIATHLPSDIMVISHKSPYSYRL